LSGVKDATFDMLIHATYQRTLADEHFDVALGTEALWLPARSLGCESFIPGLGNAYPELCRTAHRQGMAGEWEACRESQFLINELREVMYLARSTQLAVYAMLELRGIITAYPRLPFTPATGAEKNSIAEALRRLELL
jgi:dihydrodipicolinate synthase/N-acetylneuraminate lyase